MKISGWSEIYLGSLSAYLYRDKDGWWFPSGFHLLDLLEPPKGPNLQDECEFALPHPWTELIWREDFFSSCHNEGLPHVMWPNKQGVWEGCTGPLIVDTEAGEVVGYEEGTCATAMIEAGMVDDKGWPCAKWSITEFEY